MALGRVPMEPLLADTTAAAADTVATEEALPGDAEEAPQAELRVGAARASDMAVVRDHLYWKP